MILREQLTLKDGVPISRKGLWRLPSYDRKLTAEEIKEIKKVNKFLNAMQTRIRTLIRNKKLKEAQRLSEKLLRKSKGFHLYVANRSIKGWYWRMTQEKWMKEFNKFRSAVSNLKSQLDVSRHYILKADGKRLRPIGAPSHWSKMVYLSLEIVLREFLEPQIGEYQHGFMRNRGTQTASLDLINKVKGKSQVYQFDLDGCFNRINYRLICGRINSMWKGMGNLLLNITLRTFPKIQEYHEEKEIFKIEGKYVKRGFTQGSPLSPLLSIWAMEFAKLGEIEGIVMYADDGIIVRDNIGEDVERELTTASQKVGGIILAEDKGNGWVSNFKFLGLDYDLTKQTVSWNGRVVKFCDAKGVQELVKFSRYGKVEINKWEIMEESTLWNKYKFTSVVKENFKKKGLAGIWDIYYIWHRIIFNRSIDDFIDIQSESTKCCAWTLMNTSSLSSWRTRRLPLGKYKGWDITKKWNAGIEGKTTWYWTNENWASISNKSIESWPLRKQDRS